VLYPECLFLDSQSSLGLAQAAEPCGSHLWHAEQNLVQNTSSILGDHFKETLNMFKNACIARDEETFQRRWTRLIDFIGKLNLQNPKALKYFSTLEKCAPSGVNERQITLILSAFPMTWLNTDVLDSAINQVLPEHMRTYTDDIISNIIRIPN